MEKTTQWVGAVLPAVLLSCAGCASTGAHTGEANAGASEMGEQSEEPALALQSDEESSEEVAEPASDAPPEPAFIPGMSVAQAASAVPNTVDRLNIEQEALAAPLMDPALYEPCSLQGHHHFKLKVAVWDGKAVGLDVTTEPGDEKLEACIRQQVEAVEWRDRAKSLNTVEYSY